GLLQAVCNSGAEGNLHSSPVARIHLPDLSPAPNDNVRIVRRPGVTCVHTKSCPGFLLVLGQAVKKCFLPPGSQLSREKHRAGPHTANESHVLAIGADLWPHSTSRAAHHSLRLARGAVVTAYHENLTVRILIILKISSGVHILAVVQVPAIRRHTRFVDILLVVFPFRQLHALTAAYVVHPHLPGSQ